MTQEKAAKEAKELVDKFLPFAECDVYPKSDKEGEFKNGATVENAKQCALICVQKIIDLCAEGLSETKYWQSVKTEIEKL